MTLTNDGDLYDFPVISLPLNLTCVFFCLKYKGDTFACMFLCSIYLNRTQAHTLDFWSLLFQKCTRQTLPCTILIHILASASAGMSAPSFMQGGQIPYSINFVLRRIDSQQCWCYKAEVWLLQIGNWARTEQRYKQRDALLGGNLTQWRLQGSAMHISSTSSLQWCGSDNFLEGAQGLENSRGFNPEPS